jgi:hypothetical protein
MTPPRYAFFLGGHDLEMVTTAGLLSDLRAEGDARVAEVHDPGLAWGARVSDHGDGPREAMARGLLPVLVELTANVPPPLGSIEIDHHGERSGEPASIRQIFDLLSLPPERWTRDFALVAANDTGHIPALRRMGATDAEIADIRARDRRAQGITAAEEAAGLAALAKADVVLDGSLIVVRLPHGRTATVADPLALRGEDRDLLVLCPGSTQFFGAGDRIARLDAALPGGWRGGELPRRGFWGLPRPVSVPDLLSILS